MADNPKDQSDFIIYTSPDGDVNIEVTVQDETVWLTQKAIGRLFGVAKSTISEHLSNVYDSGELQREATVRNFRTVQTEGEREVTRNLEYYNLDAFLKFNEYEVLDNPGRVSARVAKQLAEKEYSKFRVVQDQTFESDFDKEVKKMLKKKK